MEDKIVNTNEFYNSTRLLNDITLLNRLYSFLNIQIIGNSILGSPIFAIKLGRGSKEVFYSASIHANEWITSLVLMKFVEDYCRAYVTNGNLYGYNVKDLFNSVSIYISPMVNPDGVGLTFIGIFYVCFNNSLISIFSLTYSLIQFNLLNAKWM